MAELGIKQIACGVNYTVLLLMNGEVMGFGLNSYGQLVSNTNNHLIFKKIPIGGDDCVDGL